MKLQSVCKYYTYQMTVLLLDIFLFWVGEVYEINSRCRVASLSFFSSIILQYGSLLTCFIPALIVSVLFTGPYLLEITLEEHFPPSFKQGQNRKYNGRKESKKTTFAVYASDVWFSCLPSPPLFCCRVVSLLVCFHPCLVSLLEIKFCRHFPPQLLLLVGFYKLTIQPILR